jgi:hypothetical protein
MKATIFVAVCAASGAGFISVNAADTAVQAVARAAWEQKMNELDRPQTPPPLEPDIPSKTAGAQPDQSATNVSRMVPEKAVTPPTAAALDKTQPAAAPATPGPIPQPAVTKSSGPPAMADSTNEIVTVTGQIYKNVRVEKMESDGIIISFPTASGGIEMTKIYANELTDALRQKYGFDRRK